LQTIDHFLNQIQDGTWHNLRTLAKNSRIPKQKLEKLCELLTEPDIVDYRPKENQVKLREKWKRLLDKTDGP